MTIKEAQSVADDIDVHSEWTEREWALRVLVGAYRREKLITAKLRGELEGVTESLNFFDPCKKA